MTSAPNTLMSVSAASSPAPGLISTQIPANVTISYLVIIKYWSGFKAYYICLLLLGMNCLVPAIEFRYSYTQPGFPHTLNIRMMETLKTSEYLFDQQYLSIFGCQCS